MISDWIPFVVGAAGAKFSFVRLIEALIIAILTAVASSQATVWRLEERIAALQRDVAKLEAHDAEQDRRIHNNSRGH
jgi:uncharacterized small protein (DUF1192 family)